MSLGVGKVNNQPIKGGTGWNRQGKIDDRQDVVLRGILVSMANQLDAGDVNKFVVFKDEDHNHCNN
jgi:hypothetical protein